MLKFSLFGPVVYVPPDAEMFPWPVATKHYDRNIGQQTFDNTLEQFELAECVGFDWVSTAEHHYATASLTGNPVVMAAAMSQRLKKARIALLGVTLPLTNPVRVAEELGILDNLTGGRLIAGMLRGTPNEFVTYGTNPAESRSMYEEGVEIILKAWSEPEPFGWQGEHYQYRVISVWPQPLQAPRPPVYLSINSPDSGAFAARKQVGGGVSYAPTPIVAQLFQNFKQHAVAAGWTPTPEQLLYRCFIHVAETDEQANQDVDKVYWGRSEGLFNVQARVSQALAAAEGKQPMTMGRRRPIFCGGPQTVADQIREFVIATGAGAFDLTFQGPGLPHKTVMHALELFGSKVIPQLADL